MYAKYSPKTTFIAYGADTSKSTLEDDDKKLLNWYKEKDVKAKNYYLVIRTYIQEK